MALNLFEFQEQFMNNSFFDKKTMWQNWNNRKNFYSEEICKMNATFKTKNRSRFYLLFLFLIVEFAFLSKKNKWNELKKSKS